MARDASLTLSLPFRQASHIQHWCPQIRYLCACVILVLCPCTANSFMFYGIPVGSAAFFVKRTHSLGFISRSFSPKRKISLINPSPRLDYARQQPRKRQEGRNNLVRSTNTKRDGRRPACPNDTKGPTERRKRSTFKFVLAVY